MGTHTDAHIVWDWNGTLFHDVDAVIGATNAAFAELGLAPITLERYRELYCVPVPRFYERLMGRLPTQAEWEVIYPSGKPQTFPLKTYHAIDVLADLDGDDTAAVA